MPSVLTGRPSNAASLGMPLLHAASAGSSMLQRRSSLGLQSGSPTAGGSKHADVYLTELLSYSLDRLRKVRRSVQHRCCCRRGGVAGRGVAGRSFDGGELMHLGVELSIAGSLQACHCAWLHPCIAAAAFMLGPLARWAACAETAAARTRRCAHTRTRAHKHTHARTSTHTHAQAHTHTHTHTQHNTTHKHTHNTRTPPLPPPPRSRSSWRRSASSWSARCRRAR